MLKDDTSEFGPLYQFVDLLICSLIMLGALTIPGMLVGEDLAQAASIKFMAFGLASVMAWPLTFQLLDVYAFERRAPLGEIMRQLITLGIGISLIQWGLLISLEPPVARSFSLICSGLQFAALFLLRLVVYFASRWISSSKRYSRNVIIVGAGPRAAYVRNVIEEHTSWGIHILGFVDNGNFPGGPSVPREHIFEFSDMKGLLNDQVIDEVIVACPRAMLGSIIEVVNSCASAGVPVTLLSDLFGDFLPAPQATRFGTLPALSFAPVHHNPIMLTIKRTIDIAGALVGLLIASPVVIACAALIKYNSPGPTMFRQVRCGLNGRHFMMHKLRTMETDAESEKTELRELNEMDGPVFKMTRDPRITRVGAILRRFSLDELPQFWNVLIGDMSLVGPRPPVPVEVSEYKTFEQRRLSMRPGLTCIWQVSGRNEIGFEGWVRLDLEYIDTWSITNDIKILFKTLPAVLTGSGAS